MVARAVAGLIPAHAGKTAFPIREPAAERAHPRSRGENERRHRSVTSRSGSSPLTRGKRAQPGPHAYGGGLIPAHAGKTVSRIDNNVAMWAHPRSRGENSTPFAASCAVMGSSPLTRGKLRIVSTWPEKAGLIPAHAGKTSSGSRPPAPPRAHPRSRGENRPPPAGKALTRGSSPLTRGKRPITDPDEQRQGLIPAHAGKTSLRDTLRAGYRAHPRSRGENLPKDATVREVRGSSPLTRGKLTARRRDRLIGGLIPAHAGKTSGSRAAHSQPWAHPRSRGEN